MVGSLEGHGGLSGWITGKCYIFPGTFPSEQGILSWCSPRWADWTLVQRRLPRHCYNRAAVLWEFCSWVLSPECF